MHERVAGAPTLEEAVDRRAQVDRGQLGAVHQPVAVDGAVRRGDALEAAFGDVGVEDHVDDVLARPHSRRRDRLHDRDRTFQPDPLEAALLGELAGQGDVQGLALLHPASRQEPVRPVALLLLQEQHGIAVPEHGADPDPGAAHAPGLTVEEPKPRSARWDGGRWSASVTVIRGRASTTSWAMRSPGRMWKGSTGSVFRSTTFSSPR